MKRPIYLCLARLPEHRPAHPERTGYRAGPGVFSDYEVREWPSPEALALTIRMQGQREPKQTDWKRWTDSRMHKAQAQASGA